MARKMTVEQRQVYDQNEDIRDVKLVLQDPATTLLTRLKLRIRLRSLLKARADRIEVDRQKRKTAQSSAVEAKRAEVARVAVAASAAILAQRKAEHDQQLAEAVQRRDAAAKVEALRLRRIPKCWRTRTRELDPITSEAKTCIFFVDRNGRAIPNSDGYRLVGDVTPQAAIEASNSGGKITLDEDPSEKWKRQAPHTPGWRGE